MEERIEEEDLKWLHEVRANGKLLEVFDLRTKEGHSNTERIEVYYYKNLFEDNELTVFIKIDDDKLVGYETY